MEKPEDLVTLPAFGLRALSIVRSWLPASDGYPTVRPAKDLLNESLVNGIIDIDRLGCIPLHNYALTSYRIRLFYVLLVSDGLWRLSLVTSKPLGIELQSSKHDSCCVLTKLAAALLGLFVILNDSLEFVICENPNPILLRP